MTAYRWSARCLWFRTSRRGSAATLAEARRMAEAARHELLVPGFNASAEVVGPDGKWWLGWPEFVWEAVPAAASGDGKRHRRYSAAHRAGAGGTPKGAIG